MAMQLRIIATLFRDHKSDRLGQKSITTLPPNFDALSRKVQLHAHAPSLPQQLATTTPRRAPVVRGVVSPTVDAPPFVALPRGRSQ